MIKRAVIIGGSSLIAMVALAGNAFAGRTWV